MHQTEAFKARIDDALGNDEVRRNFRSAMSGLMEKRAEALSDPGELQALRDQAMASRYIGLVMVRRPTPLFTTFSSSMTPGALSKVNPWCRKKPS